MYLADEKRFGRAGLSGANFFLAAGCCMALEYFARIYHGSDNALENVRQYTKQFLKPLNSRYEDACDLLWDAYRNGLIHNSWPKSISTEPSNTGEFIKVGMGVGVEPHDPHLALVSGHPENTFAINAVRF